MTINVNYGNKVIVLPASVKEAVTDAAVKDIKVLLLKYLN